MSSDLIIKIPDNSSEARITLTGRDGIKKHKSVNIDDLISTLNANNKISTGLIPNNTKFFSGTKNEYIIGIESPRRVRRFIKANYEKSVDLNIPFPVCLFVFNVAGNRIKKSRLYSLRGSLNSETQSLYRFPFGNTYEDGKICWGNNSLPKINDIQNLISIIATFYDAPFNGDLFDHRTINSNEESGSDFWSLLKFLNGKDFFPDSLLYKIRISLSSIMRDNNV